MRRPARVPAPRLLGRGIFNADGDAWRAQRKVASHEFTTRSLRAFVARCVHGELHGRLLPLLRRAAASGRALDLQDALQRFAFDNFCRVAFDHGPRQLPGGGGDGDGGGSAGSSGRFADAFRNTANFSAGRFRYAVPGFWRVKKALSVGSERRLRESVETVHDFADGIIRARREETARDGFEKQDLLSRFMASQDEGYCDSGAGCRRAAPRRGDQLPPRRAGVHVVGVHLVAAVRGRRPAGDHRGAGFDLDELREMHYVHIAITESMRLYPPVPVNSLRAETDDVLPDGTAVPAGWFVAYSSYAMGRMACVWGEDALEYRPEQWLDPAAAGGAFRPESPFRFVAFHAGPRLCLGIHAQTGRTARH
ncbi:hypothetical protein ACP70R_032872 [Stipagrostis hirtigluma subsp. patula]